MVLSYNDRYAIGKLNQSRLFTVCTEQVRSSYTEHAASPLMRLTKSCQNAHHRFVTNSDLSNPKKLCWH